MSNTTAWSCALTKKSDRKNDGILNIASAPAPWTLEVKTGYLIPFFASEQNMPFLSTHLTSTADKEHFTGQGLGVVMVLQYVDSPAGAYDELLIIPGAFNHPDPSSPQKQQNAFMDRRVPRIYVSTEASLRNGRQNWGIRKELADFEWRTESSWLYSVDHVTVKDRLTGTVFFEAKFKTMRLPVTPLAFNWIQYFIPVLVERQINAEGTPTHSNTWLQTRIGGFGWSRMAWLVECKSFDNKLHDKFFPDLNRLGCGLALHVTGSLDFLMPTAVTYSNT